ncbi:nacrein-like protein [Mytilus californianus]|uniref:nacrein-like protein n=1 Tax=Mytilus californianus TaxID=6549 RepID=UPI002246FDCA|nr:nacrein-like protein [Mytilus californianus]
MELVFLFATVAAVIVSFVDGAGYLQIRPPSLNQCCYEDINEAHFSYDRDFCEGPKNWCKVHPCWTTCGSQRRQSPININTKETSYKSYSRLKFDNINTRVPATIKNNGHAPDFDVHEDFDEEITVCNVPGRPKEKEYNFAQLHVHLGRDENKGSEHAINNIFKPMEAHMVFYDSEYEGVGEAKPKKNGLVVLSVMIEVCGKSKKNNECGVHGSCKVRFAKKLSKLMEKYYEKVRRFPHESVNPITMYMSLFGLSKKKSCSNNKCGRTPSPDFIEERCQKEEQNDRSFRVTEGITPQDVLPYDTHRFYTYAGSLTTPPCYETVQWVVYKCPIKVSRKAFRMLQLVQDSHFLPLTHFGVRRPLQKNKKVVVYSNFRN